MEPLRQHSNTRDPGKTDAETDEEALGEIKLPYSASERSGYEAACLADYADGHREVDAAFAGQCCSYGGYYHGHGEVETAY